VKKTITFIGMMGFILVGCASSTQTSPTGTRAKIDLTNLLHAKYFKGSNVIWQDMSTNNTMIVDRKSAMNYCQNLTHLGVQKWKLPSRREVRRLPSKRDIFDHDAGRGDFPDNYHTRDTVFLSDENYHYARRGGDGWIYYKIIPTYQKGLVRCVLDAEEYKKHQEINLLKASRLREKKTFNGYLESFRYTKNISDIKKAYDLASTLDEKLQAERLMVKMLPKKIFKLYSGKDGSSVAKTSGLDIGFAGSAISEKDFSKIFTLKSDFLQYGDYNVRVKFNFDITYDEQRMFSFYTSKEHKEQILTFNLNAKNGYKQTKKVLFKDITVGMAASTMGIKAINKKMKDNKLSFEIIGID